MVSKYEVVFHFHKWRVANNVLILLLSAIDDVKNFDFNDSLASEGDAVLNNLDGDVLLGLQVETLADLTKCALAQKRLDFVPEVSHKLTICPQAKISRSAPPRYSRSLGCRRRYL